MQGRSFKSNKVVIQPEITNLFTLLLNSNVFVFCLQITQEICDISRMFRLLGSDR